MSRRRRPIFMRKLKDKLVKGISILATLLGIIFLAWILLVVFARGAKMISYTFVTEPTKPYIQGIMEDPGGIANALLGTIYITLGAIVLAVPTGLLGGIYLSEFARSSGRLGNWIRFSANVMMGIPSIIVGLFVYSIIVIPMGHANGFAGSVALAFIMFPVVLRTTEDMLTMVPNELRESALALGAPRWKSTLSIIFRAAKSGLITGVLLAVARVSGETAPLLFTVHWSDSWPGPSYFSGNTANLTVTITEYAMNNPSTVTQNQAWGAALIVTFMVLCVNLLVRVFFRDRGK